MSTTEIPLKPDEDRTVRELLFELGRVEEAELRARPLTRPLDERRRRVTLRRRERQLVTELRRR